MVSVWFSGKSDGVVGEHIAGVEALGDALNGALLVIAGAQGDIGLEIAEVAVAYGDTSRNAANLTASYNHSSNLPAGQLVLSASLSALGFWEIA